MRDDLQRPAIIAALQAAAQKKGMKDVAAEMDMAPSSLYSCLNPYGDRSSSKCGLELAIAIMRYTGDKSALAIMAGELGCSIVERREPDKPTIAEEAMQDHAAVTELYKAMAQNRGAAVVHRLAMDAHSELEQTVSRYLEDGVK